MKRRFQLTVFVEYVDEVKNTAAAEAGPALRAHSSALEDMVKAQLASESPRNVSRGKIRAHVMRAEVVEVD